MNTKGEEEVNKEIDEYDNDDNLTLAERVRNRKERRMTEGSNMSGKHFKMLAEKGPNLIKVHPPLGVEERLYLKRQLRRIRKRDKRGRVKYV